jgi:hypothetical protein
MQLVPADWLIARLLDNHQYHGLETHCYNLVLSHLAFKVCGPLLTLPLSTLVTKIDENMKDNFFPAGG